MDNLILSLNIILPLFVLMAVGYLARRLKMLDDKTIRVMNNLVFRLFLPILLCKNIMDSTEGNISGGVFIFAGVGVVALYLLLFLIIPLIEKDNTKRGVMIQAIGRSNYALFGIPLVQSIFPGADTSIASLLVAITIPLYNVLSVIALEVYRGGKTDVGKIIKNIVTNPLIIGSIIGIILLKTKLPLAPFITTSIGNLAQIASPLALFMLGAFFEFSKVGHNARQLTICVIGKLVISPLIFLSLAVWLGFRGPELASLMVVFGAPTAVNSFTMAQQMGGDEELAGQQVVFSSALSTITVFLFVFAAKSFNLF
ncbi:auxin efflux carrier [uncultured Clostridium sp.]|nr:auxin efflux carrier [uncultured Clostridium sp.]